jgi:hypothetical protein
VRIWLRSVRIFRAKVEHVNISLSIEFFLTTMTKEKISDVLLVASDAFTGLCSVSLVLLFMLDVWITAFFAGLPTEKPRKEEKIHNESTRLSLFN